MRHMLQDRYPEYASKVKGYVGDVHITLVRKISVIRFYRI